MNYAEVMKEILDRVEILEKPQVLWFAEALDEYGNGRTVIEKNLHALIRSREVYQSEMEGKTYLSRQPFRLIADANRMEMDLFWVLLDAMPYSCSFVMNLMRVFQLTYINKTRTVQAVYIPRYQEKAVCRMVRELPEGSYEKEDCRIALLENPEGVSEIRKLGFQHIVTIDHETDNPREKLVVLRSFAPEDAWGDL